MLTTHPLSLQSLSQWHKQLSSSTNAARGEKATCRRPSRPSPTAPQLDDQREENINFYGGLVQRSHREANFSPPERLPHAGTPLLHDDACPEPAGKAALLSSGVGATAATAVASHRSSPFVEEDGDTAWMNTTTTMVESCSPSAPIDWWKLDSSSSSSSMFMGVDTARGAKASGSSDSTGERLRLDTRKTDVCRIELDECPRRSFGGAEKSVTVHGVCNKTINGGGGGGGSSSGGKFFNEEPAGPVAAVTSSAPPAGSCNSSGTVAAGTSAALAATIAQQHQQRTLKEQCDQHSSIRHNSNSSTSGRGSRQQEQQQAGIAVVDVDDGLGDAMPSLMTPLFMPEVDWTNETCLGGGGLDFSSSIVADGGQRLQQKQQQQQQHLWISSPASSSSNITDAELERQLEDYDYTATREELQHHLISISPYAQQQIGGGSVAFTTETSVDCGNLLVRAPGGDDGGSPISLHEEIEQLSSGFDCDATNHLVSTSSAAMELPFLASPSDEQQHGETMSLNILKWLQEDISSTIIVDRQQQQQQHHQHQQQQQQQQQQQHHHHHQQPLGLGADVLAAAISNSSHFLTDSAEIAPSPSPADRLRLPLLEATFENSLDQIQTLNRSPTPVGAGGGHKTALKSESSGSGRRHSDDAPPAAAFSTAATTTSTTSTTTTTATNTSSVDPQCDHNYFTMKRRIQDNGGGDAHSTKHKIIKLTDEHERQPSSHRSAKESVARSANAASCWCADDGSFSTLEPRNTTGPHKPNVKQTAANAAPLPAASHDSAATATTVASTFERRPSVAHRKAPTLKVHVGGGIAQTAMAASLLSGQDPFLALNKTPMMTTTTTTTTSTTNLIHQHRPLPQVTLNTPDLTNDILDLEDEKFDLLSFIDTNDDSLDLNRYHSVADEKPTLEDVLPSASLKEGEGEEEGHEEQQELAASKKSDANSGSSNSSSSSSSVKNSPEKKIYPFLTLDSLRQMTASTTDASEDSTMVRSTLSSPSASLLRTQQHQLTHHGSNNSNYSIGSRSSASSVCGDSDVSSSTTAQTPKRRGRPPKAVGTVRDRSQYEHLSEADWRYREQRDKNNEASRKSRINRKDRELKLESEADRLNMQHQKLSYEERRLQRDCQKWRKAVMKLALL